MSVPFDYDTWKTTPPEEPDDCRECGTEAFLRDGLCPECWADGYADAHESEFRERAAGLLDDEPDDDY